MSDAPLVDCPVCAKSQLRKKLSAAAFHLKGSGWYQTDFRGGNKPPAESESGAEPKDKEARVEAKDSGAGSGAGSKEAASKESNSESKTPTPKTPDSSAA